MLGESYLRRLDRTDARMRRYSEEYTQIVSELGTLEDEDLVMLVSGLKRTIEDFKKNKRNVLTLRDISRAFDDFMDNPRHRFLQDHIYAYKWAKQTTRQRIQILEDLLNLVKEEQVKRVGSETNDTD